MMEEYPQSDSEKPWPWPPWTYSGCKVHSQSFSKISAISNQISTLLVALIKEGLDLAMVSRPMVGPKYSFFCFHLSWFRNKTTPLCLRNGTLSALSVSLWESNMPTHCCEKNIDAEGIQDLWLLMRATGAHAPFRLPGLVGTSTQTLRSLRMHLCSGYVFMEAEQMALFMSVSRNPGSRCCP